MSSGLEGGEDRENVKGKKGSCDPEKAEGRRRIGRESILFDGILIFAECKNF
jgi:hypothetical protein